MNKHLGYLGLLSLVLMVTSSMPTPALAPVTPSTDDNVLVYAMPYDFDEYSAFSADSYATNQWVSAVYARLYKRVASADRDWQPDLTTGLPTVSVDGLTFSVELKSGLKFSNGNDLTTSDVLFSLKASVAPAINTYSYGSFVDFMDNDSAVITDATHMSFTLLQPFAFIYQLLSTIPIVDEETFSARYDSCVAGTLADCTWNAADGSDVVSAGPFKIAYIDNVNEIVSVVKNDNYYGADHVYTDRIIYQKIASEPAAVSSLAAGLIDILDAQYVPGLTELQSLNGVDEAIVGDPSHQEISLNHLNPYFGTGAMIPGNGGVTDLEDAKLVRKAMSHIVDRDYAVNEILEGLGLPAATIMPGAAVGWDATLPARNYSISTARALMTQAGFDYASLGTEQVDGTFPSNFFDVVLLSPDTNPARNQWSDAYALELPKIGIGVTQHVSTGWGEIIPRTFGYSGGGLPGAYADGGYDVFFVGNSWNLDWNPSAYFDSKGRCDTGDCSNFYNFDIYENESNIATLVNDYITELDFDTRIAKVKLLQAEMYEWEPVLPILYPEAHWGFRDNLVGIDSLLISTAAQEWDLVGKTGWIPTTVTVTNTNTATATISATVSNTVTNTATVSNTVTNTNTVSTTVPATVTETNSSPISSFVVVFSLFFASVIAVYMRRRKF